ncbi:unnamed protein product [Paramecium sonneborni]|uniref:Uncharacterized protein n=1 Tax=Paramecium sonneborni TaxID=65129 RepID=A0A8S1RVM8_9CILI|nr:unnamed protein product [Paramecium sonneborni]
MHLKIYPQHRDNYFLIKRLQIDQLTMEDFLQIDQKPFLNHNINKLIQINLILLHLYHQVCKIYIIILFQMNKVMYEILTLKKFSQRLKLIKLD